MYYQWANIENKTNTLKTILPDFEDGKIVRHITANSKTFHSATDNLAGTAVYGKPNDTNNNFSIKFHDEEFSHFLFMSGDKKNWAIIRKSEVAKCGANKYLRIEKSSRKG